MKKKSFGPKITERRSLLRRPAPTDLAVCAAPVLLGMCLLHPAEVQALGFRVPNQDAEAIARGNAFTATADNPSAIYYNPAGITQLDGANAQFGLHDLSINSFYNSPTHSAESKFAVNVVPQFYATYTPSNCPLSFGVGMYAPYGLELEWPVGSIFRTDGSSVFQGRLTYVTLNPVVAWKISDQLSLAAGPTLNYAQLLMISSAGMGQLKFRGDDFEPGFTAGLMWKPFEQWSFGANYHGATSMNFSGNTTTSYGSGHGSVEVPMAQFGMVGVSYRPTPKWNFEADVDYTDWHVERTLTFNTQSPFGNFGFPLNWKSSVMLELGGTRYLSHGYFVSAGYFFSENSTSSQNFTPIVPDTDLHVGSLGFGHKGDRWAWAISAQIITGPQRTVSGDQSDPSANGQYQWINESVNFSVRYHF